MEKPPHETAYDGSHSMVARPQVGLSTYIKPQGRKPHDPDVQFEEYYHYAQKTRVEEKAFIAPKTNWKAIMLRRKQDKEHGDEASNAIIKDIKGEMLVVLLGQLHGVLVFT
jgi:hypothetical protein